MCTPEVKVNLFRRYCSPFHTAQLWYKYRQYSIRRLNVVYNDALRIYTMIFPGYNQARMGKTVLSFYIPATTPPSMDSRYSLSYEHTPRPAAKSPCYTPISSRASTPRTEIGSPSLQYSQEFCSPSASPTSPKCYRSDPIYQLMNDAAYEEFRKKHFPLFHYYSQFPLSNSKLNAKYVFVLCFNISN